MVVGSIAYTANMTGAKHVAERVKDVGSDVGAAISVTAIGVLVLAVPVAVGVVLAAGPIAERLGGTDTSGAMGIAALIMGVEIVSGGAMGVLAGFEDYRSIGRVSVLSGVMMLAASIALALRSGVTGAITGLALASGARLFGLVWAVIGHCKARGLKLDVTKGIAEIGILRTFSLPLVLSTAVVGPVMWYAQFLLGVQPNGLDALGLFGAAMRLQSIPMFLGLALGLPMVPILASARKGQSTWFDHINLMISWAPGVLIALPVLAFPELLGILFGPEFRSPEATRTASIVMFFGLVNLYKQGLGRVIIARGRVRLSVVSNGVWAVVVLSLAPFAVQHGSAGLAWSLVVAYLLSVVVVVPWLLRSLEVPRAALLSVEAASLWTLIVLLWIGGLWSVSWTLRLPLIIGATYLTIRPLISLFSAADKLATQDG